MLITSHFEGKRYRNLEIDNEYNFLPELGLQRPSNQLKTRKLTMTSKANIMTSLSEFYEPILFP